MMSVTLSDEFQPFADEIMASRKPSVPFTLSCAETRLWQSKVGGKPYLPLDMAYPNNPDGEPLFFLAQVNFAEMPALPDFPTKGILQFYIDGKDDCYGINHEDYSDHSRYKLVYHADVMEDVSKLQQDFDFIDFDENEDYGVPFPAHHSYQIHFQSVAQQIITREDFSFAQVLPRLSSFLDEKCEDRKYNWELHDQYAELTDNEQHRIGGYPFFTQDDVRGWNEELKDYILLFQLVSDYDYDEEGNKSQIMWGDCGVGNFFIHPDDLKNLEFDQVFFYMDCT